MLSRHPFPGPGLAIRCLCAPKREEVERREHGWLLPVRSVGVQGDSRSYRSVLLLEDSPASPGVHDKATHLINALSEVNRVVALAGSADPVSAMSVWPSEISAERLDRLRAADAIVRRLSLASGFEDDVWQFPVVLIPLGAAARPDSIVLRPIHSIDGMTARSVTMPEPLLAEMVRQLLAIDGVAAVLYDLTHKPPGTIEWE